MKDVDYFNIDDLRDPSAVIWKREGGFGVDYYWSVDHFAEVCNLSLESGLPVTICNEGVEVLVVSPATQE